MLVAPYIAILLLMKLLLASFVIKKRHSAAVSMGDGSDKHLARLIRADGNFTEYAALMAVALVVAEFSGVGALWLHILAIGFIIGRALHALAFVYTWRGSQHFLIRRLGMILTLSSFLFIGFLLVVN